MPPAGSLQHLPSPTEASPLLAWLLTALKPMSRTRIKDVLAQGRIRVNGTAVTQFNHLLRPTDQLALAPAAGAPAESRLALPIAFEDDAIIVLDKPCGLLSVATESEKLDTAFVQLSADLEKRRAGRPFVVHRLDRETSGLLLFARTREIRDKLQANWDAVEKTYLAVVEGKPRPPQGTVRNFLTEGRDLRVRIVPPGGAAREAVSRYRVVSAEGSRSLVEVVLETGRKHQIRVQLAGLGCPVIGDRMYGAKTDLAGRLGLHAWRLAFDHPVTGRRVTIESPLPTKLERWAGREPRPGKPG